MNTRSLFTAVAALGLGILTLACGDKDDDTGAAACSAGDFQCDGEVLQECQGGEWTDSEDCEALGMQCHAEMGHCMEM